MWWIEEFLDDRATRNVLSNIANKSGIALSVDEGHHKSKNHIRGFLKFSENTEALIAEPVVLACLYIKSNMKIPDTLKISVLHMISVEQRELRESGWEDGAVVGRSAALSMLRKVVKGETGYLTTRPSKDRQSSSTEKHETVHAQDVFVADFQDINQQYAAAAIVENNIEQNTVLSHDVQIDELRCKRSEAARRGNIARGAERRSEITARGNLTRGPERRREISLKAAATLRAKKAAMAA